MHTLPTLLLLTASLASTAASAKTVHYRCDGGRTMSVRYDMGEATMSARLTGAGTARTLQRSDAESNAERLVLRQGDWHLNLDNGPHPEKARGVMLMRDGHAVVNGQRMPVSRILRKGCDPR